VRLGKHPGAPAAVPKAQTREATSSRCACAAPGSGDSGERAPWYGGRDIRLEAYFRDSASSVSTIPGRGQRWLARGCFANGICAP
jgi:hypothetical protein